jgi:rhodanese-related sulfurtransferase
MFVRPLTVDSMKRRTFLAGSLVAATGCLGRGSSTDGSGSTDGYPPKTFENTPAKREIDTSSFETLEVNGVEVPLAPIEVTHYWYMRHEARFVDARGPTQYENSHILGAALSTAPDGGQSDPVDDWPKGDRIVCYCGCPHHLSSLRAANLIQNGYENVYVIDEGFWEWYERGYPMAGTEVKNRPKSYEIRGRTAAKFAGETVWAWHDASGQREAAPIGEGGEYSLHLKFFDVTLDSVIRVETPSYAVEAPLRELTTGPVTEALAEPEL